MMLLISVVVGPIIHVIDIIKKNEDTKKVLMRKRQKQAYIVSLIGSFIFAFAILLSIIMLVIYIIKLFSFGPEGVGYILGLFVLPKVAVLVIAFLNTYVPLMYSVPTVYKNVQQVSSIFFIVAGMFGMATMSFIIYMILNSIIEATYDQLAQFNPFQIIFAIFYLAPICLIIGGVLGLLDFRKNKIS